MVDSLGSANSQLEDLYPCRGLDVAPLMELLEDVEWMLRSLDAVGPKFDTPALLQKLEDEIFDSGRLRSFVAGQAIEWNETPSELKTSVLECLESSKLYSAAAADSYLNAMARRRLESAACITRDSKYPKSDLAAAGLCFATNHPRFLSKDLQGTTFEYAEVGKDWARFIVRLRDLRPLVHSAVVDCLREGRVIAFEPTASFYSLKSPRDWIDVSGLPAPKSGMRYILTSCLPISWTNKRFGPKTPEEIKNKNRAMGFARDHFEHAKDSKKRFTKSQLDAELTREFGITSKAELRGIWKEVTKGAWEHSGRPRKNGLYTFETNGEKT